MTFRSDTVTGTASGFSMRTFSWSRMFKWIQSMSRFNCPTDSTHICRTSADKSLQVAEGPLQAHLETGGTAQSHSTQGEAAGPCVHWKPAVHGIAAAEARVPGLLCWSHWGTRRAGESPNQPGSTPLWEPSSSCRSGVCGFHLGRNALNASVMLCLGVTDSWPC